MADPLVIGFLGDYVRESVFVALIGVVVLLRYRRYKAIGGAAVGAASSTATVAVAVVVTLFALVALGYWEPPVGEIVGDTLGVGRAVYDTVGRWVLERLLGGLEGVAA
jgi:hypothetical protein